MTDAETGPPVLLHFASSTGHGGDALHVLTLAHGQRALGYDARILIGESEHTRTFADRARAADVPCAVEPRLPLLEGQSLGGPLRQLERMLVFRNHLRAQRPAVVHLHSGGLALRTVEVLGARLAPCELRVATVHCGYPWAPGSERARAGWRRAATLLDRIITPSRVSAAFQQDAGIERERIDVLPNAVDASRIVEGDGDSARRELGLAPGQPLVLFLARVEHEKRPQNVVRAFAAIADRAPDARLAVVGDGGLRAECERVAAELGAKDRIDFLGYRTDVPNLMKAADVYVLPTVAESFGLTLVEAMAAGTAIVTTDAPPMRGEVIPDDGAEFVPIDDLDALAAAMLRLLLDPERRRTLAVAGRARAEARFSVLAVAREHIAFYDAVLRATGRRPLTASARTGSPPAPAAAP